MRRPMPTRLLPRLQPPIGSFSGQVLARDLPDLTAERRAEVVAFVERRVATIPTPMRTGVGLVAVVVAGLGRLLGGRRVAGLLASRPLPVAGEYVRLVRSLAYAYVWETWPDTTPSGGRP